MAKKESTVIYVVTSVHANDSCDDNISLRHNGVQFVGKTMDECKDFVKDWIDSEIPFYQEGLDATDIDTEFEDNKITVKGQINGRQFIDTFRIDSILISFNPYYNKNTNMPYIALDLRDFL